MAKYWIEIFYTIAFRGSWAFFAYFAELFCIHAMSADRPRMRVLLVCCVVLFCFCRHAFGQVGNEWIVFTQQYYKIPVGKDGVYKLNFAALQSAGFPAATVDPQKIQLFHRGEEQSIYIEGEGDGLFDPSDFIEFYGQRNDGTLDVGLYENATDQPHALYNLYSDTTAYFLTIGSAPGKRIPTFYEDNTGGLIAETFHIDEKTLVLTSQYATGLDYGEIQKTSFGMGEGWSASLDFQRKFCGLYHRQRHNAVQAAGNPELEVLLVGRGPMGHSAEVLVGQSNRLLGTVEFNGYESFKFIQPIEWTDIAARRHA